MIKAILVVLVFYSQSAYSQSSQDKAMWAFLKAEEQFDAGNYQACLNKLDEVISLIGSSNARIQYYKAKSYNGLGNQTQTKKEIEKYFTLNPNKDDWYKEMLALSEEIDNKIKAQQAEEVRLQKEREEADRKTKADDEAWFSAMVSDSEIGYEAYLVLHPNGKHSQEANEKIEKIYFDKAWNTNTIENWNRYLKRFPNGKKQNVSDAYHNLNLLKNKKAINENPNEYLEKELIKSSPNVKYIWDAILKGANPNMEVKGGNSLIISPLSIGVYFNRNEIIKYLSDIFAKGTNANQLSAKSTDDPKPACANYYVIKDYITRYLDYSEPDEDLLLEILKLFVKNGLDVNVSDGVILFTLVERHNEPTSSPSRKINTSKIVEFLLQNKAEPKLNKNVSCYSNGYYHQGYIRHTRNSAYKEAKDKGRYDLITLFDKYKK